MAVREKDLMETENDLTGDDRVVISRRLALGFIATTAAIPVSTLASNAFAAPLSQAAGDVRYVLTDKRHPESLEFAATFARRGAERLEVTDGLTRLWREKLVPLWGAEGGAIAGLTGHEAWVCVAEQARSCGRRSLLSARHAVAVNGHVSEHFLTAAAPTLVDAAALERCSDAWPSVMADLAARSLESPRSPRIDGRFRASGAPSPSVSSPHLASWVIA